MTPEPGLPEAVFRFRPAQGSARDVTNRHMRATLLDGEPAWLDVKVCCAQHGTVASSDVLTRRPIIGKSVGRVTRIGTRRESIGAVLKMRVVP